jgi:cyclopropane fatty-acyl-phospholipid synthase-like methyltransferase
LACLYPDVVVDAVTVSPVQVELAQGVIAKAGVVGRVHAQVADYHELPFEDDTFDHVMFLETVGYSYDHHKAFREVLRVLKPGGKVYVKDVYRIETPLTPQQRVDLDSMEELWASGPVCSMSELAQVFREVGFEDVDQVVIENVGGYRYTGGMLEPDDKGGLKLNAFGRRFYQTYADLPTLIGHVVGQAPLS